MWVFVVVCIFMVLVTAFLLYLGLTDRVVQWDVKFEGMLSIRSHFGSRRAGFKQSGTSKAGCLVVQWVHSLADQLPKLIKLREILQGLNLAAIIFFVPMPSRPSN